MSKEKALEVIGNVADRLARKMIHETLDVWRKWGAPEVGYMWYVLSILRWLKRYIPTIDLNGPRR